MSPGKRASSACGRSAPNAPREEDQAGAAGGEEGGKGGCIQQLSSASKHAFAHYACAGILLPPNAVGQPAGQQQEQQRPPTCMVAITLYVSSERSSGCCSRRAMYTSSSSAAGRGAAGALLPHSLMPLRGSETVKGRAARGGLAREGGRPTLPGPAPACMCRGRLPWNKRKHAPMPAQHLMHASPRRDSMAAGSSRSPAHPGRC